MGLIVTPGGVTMLATMAGLLARLGGEAPGATARGRLRACCGTIAGETTFLPPAADPAGTRCTDTSWLARNCALDVTGRALCC